MTKWYTKYLEVFEKPIDSVSEQTVNEVRKKLMALQSKEPVVSVVLIAHNVETHLLACLWSLCDNTCPVPMEILTVNNNSTDKTTEVLDRLGATWFDEKLKGPGHARQCGLNHAKGKYHICIDADTMYPPHYIETHLKELMKPEVACTFALWSFVPRKGESVWALRVYESLRDLHLRIQAVKRPELCVRGMVFGFKTEYGRQIGFRTDIIRGEDGSLALAMKPMGRLVFITSRKARALTSNSTLNADGSLLKSFTKRLIKACRGLGGIFTKKEKYEDQDSNIIKR